MGLVEGERRKNRGRGFCVLVLFCEVVTDNILRERCLNWLKALYW